MTYIDPNTNEEVDVLAWPPGKVRAFVRTGRLIEKDDATE